MSCIIIQLICNNKQKQYDFAHSSMAKIEIWEGGRSIKKTNKNHPDFTQDIQGSQLKRASLLKEVFCYSITNDNRRVSTALELEKCLHGIVVLYEV